MYLLQKPSTSSSAIVSVGKRKRSMRQTFSMSSRASLVVFVVAIINQYSITITSSQDVGIQEVGDYVTDDIVNLEEEDIDRDLVGRIIGGNPAKKGDFPWYGTPARNWWCGAAMIWPDVMITAAHCAGFFDGGVKIGHVNYYDDSYTDIIPVQSYHKHPSFDENTFVNDIALIKLNRTSKVSMPLLRWNANRNFPSPNATVRIMGFGYVSFPNGPTSDNLLQVDVRIIDFNLCLQAYSNYTGDGEVLSRGRMICAGNWGVGGKDSCLGDSGGPLISQGQVYNNFLRKYVKVNTLVGIVSWGDQCGLAYRPGVYTQVATYDNWIRTTMCRITSVKCPTPRRPPTKAPTKAPDCIPVMVPPPRQPSATRPTTTGTNKSVSLTDYLQGRTQTVVRSSFIPKNMRSDNNSSNCHTEESGFGGELSNVTSTSTIKNGTTTPTSTSNNTTKP
jgi:trypsin